jgi:hypothetical protein
MAEYLTVLRSLVDTGAVEFSGQTIRCAAELAPGVQPGRLGWLCLPGRHAGRLGMVCCLSRRLLLGDSCPDVTLALGRGRPAALDADARGPSAMPPCGRSRGVAAGRRRHMTLAPRSGWPVVGSRQDGKIADAESPLAVVPATGCGYRRPQAPTSRRWAWNARSVGPARAHRRAKRQQLLVPAVSLLGAIVAVGREEAECHRRQSLCTSTIIIATRCARFSSIP